MNSIKKRTGNAEVVAVMNMKGGVTKTTSSIAAAAVLTEMGYKVLLIDYDPQSSATSCLGFGVEDTDEEVYTSEGILNDDIELYGIAEIMHDNMKRAPENDWHELVVTTEEGYDFIPSSIDLAAVEADMQVNGFLKEETLKRALKYMRPEYDYIIVDCPPTLSLLFTNITTAANSVIIPVAPEKSALRGFKLLYRKIHEVKDLLNPELEISGILITKVDARSNKIKENMERIKKLAPVVRIFELSVPYGLKDAETAAENGISFIGLCNRTKKPSELLVRITEAYRSMIREVIG